MLVARLRALVKKKEHKFQEICVSSVKSIYDIKVSIESHNRNENYSNENIFCTNHIIRVLVGWEHIL